MFKKFKVLLIIASLAITLSLMSNTYSRYVASSQGNVEIEFAKWQVLVNNVDITNKTSSKLDLKPVIDTNNGNVAQNKVAPSSSGYFDVEIDPTNVDVSFKYSIELSFTNNLKDESGNNIEIEDLIITEYAILPENYTENDGLKTVAINDSSISDTMLYQAGGFNPFTVRIFFEWFEGQTEDMAETMNDEADTAIGLAAANLTDTNNDSTENNTVDTTEENTAQEEAAFTINANINFEQYIG